MKIQQQQLLLQIQKDILIVFHYSLFELKKRKNRKKEYTINKTPKAILYLGSILKGKLCQKIIIVPSVK